MINNKQSMLGSNNIQIIGNNNNIQSAMAPSQQQVLTHSLIHELLDIVYSLPTSTNRFYSLNSPVQIHAKLRFNNARKYIHIIDNHADDYARVDEVMKDYPDSEIIVKKLHDMFIEVAEFDENGIPCIGNGDAQLESIKSTLFRTIISDSKFDVDRHPVEIIDQFCIALIAYGVSKCKILETPV